MNKDAEAVCQETTPVAERANMLYSGCFVSAGNGQLNLDTVSDAFITSIVLIVAAVPEGLPTIVAVSLALNIIKMSRENALVKKMIACETIGCVNIICSDKTGTLTENKMTVQKIYTNGELIEPEALKDEKLLKLSECGNRSQDAHRR